MMEEQQRMLTEQEIREMIGLPETPRKKRPVTLWVVLLIAVIAAVILVLCDAYTQPTPPAEEEEPTAAVVNVIE